MQTMFEKMFRIILPFLLIVFSHNLLANPGLARISDKDGFTNIRSGPGKDFDIVATVNKDDFFYADNSDSSWVFVQILQWKNGQQITGYIFKNNIRFISTLPDSEKQILFQSVFQKQINYAIKFEHVFLYKDTTNYKKTRAELESYSELKFDPILNLYADFYCKTNDSLTLQLLMKEIEINSGSADEWPGDVLSDCFICHADFVLGQIKRIKNKNDRKFIIEDIEYGMGGHYSIDENKPITNKEFLRLKKLLHTAN